MSAEVFKKAGWRPNRVVVYWGKNHQSPLCPVSDLHPDWSLIALHRRRYPIEATFCDYKSYGWHWEQGQVIDLQHVPRLFIGTQVGQEILDSYQTHHHRRIRPYEGKRSLFQLGRPTLLSGCLPVCLCLTCLFSVLLDS